MPEDELDETLGGLERLLFYPETTAQRTGKDAGGGVLDQSVLRRPAEASGRVNAAPFVSLTVTFSLVGVVL